MDTAILTSLYADLVLLHATEYRFHQKAAGEQFYDVHELTERFYEDTEDHFHMLGERAAYLNANIPARPKSLSAASEVIDKIQPSDGGNVDAGRVVELELVYKNAIGNRLAEAIEAFEDDAVTEDILIEILREQEKHMYLLKQLMS